MGTSDSKQIKTRETTPIKSPLVNKSIEKPIQTIIKQKSPIKLPKKIDENILKVDEINDTLFFLERFREINSFFNLNTEIQDIKNSNNGVSNKYIYYTWFKKNEIQIKKESIFNKNEVFSIKKEEINEKISDNKIENINESKQIEKFFNFNIQKTDLSKSKLKQTDKNQKKDENSLEKHVIFEEKTSTIIKEPAKTNERFNSPNKKQENIPEILKNNYEENNIYLKKPQFQENLPESPPKQIHYNLEQKEFKEENHQKKNIFNSPLRKKLDKHFYSPINPNFGFSSKLLSPLIPDKTTEKNDYLKKFANRKPENSTSQNEIKKKPIKRNDISIENYKEKSIDKSIENEGRSLTAESRIIQKEKMYTYHMKQNPNFKQFIAQKTNNTPSTQKISSYTTQNLIKKQKEKMEFIKNDSNKKTNYNINKLTKISNGDNVLNVKINLEKFKKKNENENTPNSKRKDENENTPNSKRNILKIQKNKFFDEKMKLQKNN